MKRKSYSGSLLQEPQPGNIEQPCLRGPRLLLAWIDRKILPLRTLPRHISSTKAGLMLPFSITAFSILSTRASSCVSRRLPLWPLHIGDRIARVMTTSLGSLRSLGGVSKALYRMVGVPHMLSIANVSVISSKNVTLGKWRRNCSSSDDKRATRSPTFGSCPALPTPLG